MSEALSRARLSLDGLSVGDAFGERFFLRGKLVRAMIASRAIPQAPWRTTDDTEMAVAIFEVLERFDAIDQDALAAAFARRYARDPMRGYGGTAHEILQDLGRGLPWHEAAGAAFEGSGSMGNGGAMRVAPLGAYFAGDLPRAAAEARASAEVTHAHPEGQAGAVAIGVAAAWAAARDEEGPPELFERVLDHCPAGATREGILRARDLLDVDDVAKAVAELGNGSRVTAEDTVPFTLWAAAKNLDDYEEALWRTVEGLGDRDTTCAIVGGIVALTSRHPIPRAWLEAREPLSFHV